MFERTWVERIECHCRQRTRQRNIKFKINVKNFTLTSSFVECWVCRLRWVEAFGQFPSSRRSRLPLGRVSFYFFIHYFIPFCTWKLSLSSSSNSIQFKYWVHTSRNWFYCHFDVLHEFTVSGSLAQGARKLDSIKNITILHFNVNYERRQK